jgi:hypothetical protein
MRKISEYLHNTELELVDLLVAFIVVTSGIMLLQLVLGIFEPVSALFLSLLICGAIGLAFVRKIDLPMDYRNIAAIALMGVLVLMPRWSPFLYVEGGQDEGLYVSMSSHFARAQGLTIKDQVREKLSEGQKLVYDKNNNHYDDKVVPQRYEGFHQPGVLISDLSNSSYIFQFYPLHPLWMALVGKVLGGENKVYSLVCFSLLNILMLSLLVYELSGRKRAPAFLAAGLLALNPMHVFLSRFPVTENVTVFFSASAFYFLLRYFKDREQGKEQAFHLILSAGSYACLCFNHLAGFMYLPFFLLVLIAGMVSTDSVKRVQHLAGYGLALAVAYFLSLWYGVTWSYPYSYDVYRSIFGVGVGTFFINHWAGTTVSFFFVSVAIIYLTWRFRSRFQSEWNRLGLNKVMVLVLFALQVCAISYAILQAYRLGFTSAYSQDEWLAKYWGLSQKGFAGFGHSSLITLILYVSPFLFAFLLVSFYSKRNSINIYETFLIVLITLFLILRTVIEPFTPYYYYGRYLCGELLPYLIVMASLWLHHSLVDEKRYRNVTAKVLIGLTLTWQVVALAQQYPGGEMHRLHTGLKPLIEKINDDDLLVYDGNPLPTLPTAFQYFYGKQTAIAEPEKLRDFVRESLNTWADVYVLSSSNTLEGYSYVGAFSFVRDTYKRGGFDLLPINSWSQSHRYYLYRADRQEFFKLHQGDSIDFSQDGNAAKYLGYNWSHQEKSFRWTDGESASLNLPFSEINSDLLLNINLQSHNCVDVTVRVNGEIRTPWSFAGCKGFEDRTLLLRREDLKAGSVNVSFDMPGVKSPHDLNSAHGDSRKLGIAVTKITVGKAIPAVNTVTQKQNDTSQLEVNFRNEYPPFIAGTDGISQKESWGRWTDGNKASIKFQKVLPLKFALTVEGQAFGPNVGKPVVFRVGTKEKEIVFNSAPQIYRVEFNLDKPSDTLEILIPEPSQPNNGDNRKLGVGLVNLSISG